MKCYLDHQYTRDENGALLIGKEAGGLGLPHAHLCKLCVLLGNPRFLGWADFRDGETQGPRGGDTCLESHSPEGWSQGLSGQPEPKTFHQAMPRLQDQELIPPLCFLSISKPGLFVGTANLARAPQRLPRGKHAQDAPSVEIMLGQDRKGPGQLHAHKCPQQEQALSSFQPPGSPIQGSPAAATVCSVALGPLSVTEQWSFQAMALLPRFFEPRAPPPW